MTEDEDDDEDHDEDEDDGEDDAEDDDRPPRLLSGPAAATVWLTRAPAPCTLGSEGQANTTL